MLSRPHRLGLRFNSIWDSLQRSKGRLDCGLRPSVDHQRHQLLTSCLDLWAVPVWLNFQSGWFVFQQSLKVRVNQRCHFERWFAIFSLLWSRVVKFHGKTRTLQLDVFICMGFVSWVFWVQDLYFCKFGKIAWLLPWNKSLLLLLIEWSTKLNRSWLS